MTARERAKRAAIVEELQVLRAQVERAMERARVLRAEAVAQGNTEAGDLIAYTYLDAAMGYAVRDMQRVFDLVKA